MSIIINIIIIIIIIVVVVVVVLDAPDLTKLSGDGGGGGGKGDSAKTLNNFFAETSSIVGNAIIRVFCHLRPFHKIPRHSVLSVLDPQKRRRNENCNASRLHSAANCGSLHRPLSEGGVRGVSMGGDCPSVMGRWRA